MSVPEMIRPDDPRLRLCVVTDDLRDGIEGLLRRMQAAVRGGATMVLLRLKHADARTLVEAARALTGGLNVPVLVRDRLDVALISGAAGVHLAANSMPVPAVRLQAPPELIVAASASTPDELARVHDADLVTVGPIFGQGGSAIGLSMLQSLVAASDAPVIAVGGLTPERASDVRRAGARGVMLVQLPQSERDIESYVAAFARNTEPTDERAA